MMTGGTPMTQETPNHGLGINSDRYHLSRGDEHPSFNQLKMMLGQAFDPIPLVLGEQNSTLKEVSIGVDEGDVQLLFRLVLAKHASSWAGLQKNPQVLKQKR